MSGEANALTGYPFPPSGNYASATWMVDGWQFTISAFIVVIDHVTLWQSPDVSATDQSQHGSQVARLDGPFVVDLHKGGPLRGKGGGSGGGARDRGHHEPERQRERVARRSIRRRPYGFGFSTRAGAPDRLQRDTT